jgi:hypothetical protein
MTKEEEKKVDYLKNHCESLHVGKRLDANGNTVWEVGYATSRSRRTVSSTNIDSLLDSIISEVESSGASKYGSESEILEGEIVE